MELDVAGLLQAEHQRTLRRARTLHARHIDHQLAAIKHDPHVRASLDIHTHMHSSFRAPVHSMHL